MSRRLFKLSQEPYQAPTTCDIKTLLAEAAGFAVSGSNVKCECEIAEDLWQVKVDESQITQVIYNLVINAQHAMPNGGTLHVQAHNESVPNTQLGPDYASPFIKVSITDSGIGIAPENLPRIFDPYFTSSEGARIITCDAFGKITALTPSAEILTGWKEIQAMGTSILEVLTLIHTQSIQGIGPFIEQVLEHQNPLSLPQPLILVTKEDIRRPVDIQIIPMKGEQPHIIGFIILLQDLVEKQDAEFARQKANQLSSICFLASGVAHDLNNLLTAILGNLSLVKSWSNAWNRLGMD